MIPSLSIEKGCCEKKKTYPPNPSFCKLQKLRTNTPPKQKKIEGKKCFFININVFLRLEDLHYIKKDTMTTETRID